MKKLINYSIVVIITGIALFSACKKDEDTKPDTSTTLSFYFKATFGSTAVNFGKNDPADRCSGITLVLVSVVVSPDTTISDTSFSFNVSDRFSNDNESVFIGFHRSKYKITDFQIGSYPYNIISDTNMSVSIYWNDSDNNSWSSGKSIQYNSTFNINSVTTDSSSQCKYTIKGTFSCILFKSNFPDPPTDSIVVTNGDFRGQFISQ